MDSVIAARVYVIQLQTKQMSKVKITPIIVPVVIAIPAENCENKINPPLSNNTPLAFDNEYISVHLVTSHTYDKSIHTVDS